MNVAAGLRAAAMFDREADLVICSHAESLLLDAKLQAATNGVLDISLPYLEGASAQQLLELRQELPEAFLEFRARMEGIVSRAMKDDPNHAAREARVIADREILPSIRLLDAELKASARKNRIVGWGTAVLSAAGQLYGALTGNGIITLGSALAGLGAPLGAAASFAGDKQMSVKNPFYFIWRARRGRG